MSVDKEELIQEAKEFMENHQELFDRLAGKTEEAARYEIKKTRELIDKLDEEIARKIRARQKAVNIIIKIKDKWDIDRKDPEREKEIKDRLISKYPEMEDTIKVLWNHLFNNVQNNS